MFSAKQRSIEVHCWGGLGSQLFALALIYDLKMRFPTRNYILVLHSSGVTRRAPEITNLPFYVDFKIIDDFSSNSRTGNLSPGKRFIKPLVRKIAQISGLLASANNDLEYQNIKPWTRQFRGHYSRRTISSQFLASLQTLLNNRMKEDSFQFAGVTVHYRLGDLLSLAEKSPIDPNRLACEIIRAQEIYLGKVALFSDSPQNALELLTSHGIECDITQSNLDSIDVLNFARNSKYFVGTSSKISYWVICLRNFHRHRIAASMPSSDVANLTPIIGEDAAKKIQYY